MGSSGALLKLDTYYSPYSAICEPKRILYPRHLLILLSKEDPLLCPHLMPRLMVCLQVCHVSSIWCSSVINWMVSSLLGFPHFVFSFYSNTQKWKSSKNSDGNTYHVSWVQGERRYWTADFLLVMPSHTYLAVECLVMKFSAMQECMMMSFFIALPSSAIKMTSWYWCTFVRPHCHYVHLMCPPHVIHVIRKIFYMLNWRDLGTRLMCS